MPVVSISLNDTLLEKLKNIEKDLGFSGRSEVVRTAIRNYISDQTKLESLEGETSAVLTIKHSEPGPDIHDYQELITSQIHDHDSDGNCLQMFIVEGNAEKVVKMKDFLEAEKNVTRVEITVL